MKVRKFVEDEKALIKREELLLKYEWRRYNVLFFTLVFLLTLESVLTGSMYRFLSSIGSYGYIGAAFAGFFFTYGVTTPFSVAAFYMLAKMLNPVLLALIGASFSVVSEYIIYDFVKKESQKMARSHEIRGLRLPKINSRFLHLISPLIAGIIIASPLPDELAAALLGAEHYGKKSFIFLAFIFNFIGIFLLTSFGKGF
jgi:hypothetical protein